MLFISLLFNGMIQNSQERSKDWDETQLNIRDEMYSNYIPEQIQCIYKWMMQFQKWLLPQMNTNYDDYILQLDGAPPPSPLFTEIYECFSIVFFNSAGSDVLQKETTTSSLGHPIRRI